MVALQDTNSETEVKHKDNVVIRLKGGGSVIDRQPVFSEDGKYLYVVCIWCVRAYSVQTGECVRHYVPDFTDDTSNLVGLAIKDNYLFAVSASGSFAMWKASTAILIKNNKFEVKNGACVAGIHLVTNVEGYDACLFISEVDKNFLSLQLYDIHSGQLIRNLCISGSNSIKSVAFGGAENDSYVAVIRENRLTVTSVTKQQKNVSFMAGNGRYWTVVACHPEECIIASGDNTGRIVLWKQPLDNGNKTPRTVCHWHTLPVEYIAFSASGSYMYSGGNEGVLVRWNVESPNIRNYLPRLPAGIAYIAVASDNQTIAVATKDNGIQLVDPQNKINCVIQNLTWGVNCVPGAKLFPAGIIWDPRTGCVILNGRPGHLQFYNPQDSSLLYNLDIANQNYLSQERDKVIVNTEITKAAVSYDGKWMVTVEMRKDQETCIELLLKFWQYKFNSRQYSLNTCVQLPHTGEITAVRFQPQSGEEQDKQYLLMTTGVDRKFRLWSPVESDSIYREGVIWKCESTGFYRDLPAGAASFSSDGSLLGVTFGPTLTIWDAEINQLKSTLTRDRNILRFVEFGQKDCCHLVVSANSTQLNVWSILTLTVVWSVPLRVSLLTADLKSSFMAAFTEDNKLFVFTPSSPQPVYKKMNLCKENVCVLAATFVPRPQKPTNSSVSWLTHSQLYFIDSNQELLYAEMEGEEQEERYIHNIIKEDQPNTPFSILVAKETHSAVEKVHHNKHIQFGSMSDAAIRELLSGPAHTMPHVSLLCLSFLKSLVVSKQVESNKEGRLSREEADLSMDVDEERKDDDDDDVKDSGMDNIAEHSEEAGGSFIPQNKSQKKKKRNKKGGKLLRKGTSDIDILGFCFDNTGDWTTKENKRTSEKKRQENNSSKIKGPPETVEDDNADTVDDTVVAEKNTADDKKENKKRKRRRRRSSTSKSN